MTDSKKNESKPHYLMHRERLRNKFLRASDALEDYELLELLLSYSIPRRDVKPVAKELLKHCGNLPGIMSAEMNSLTAVSGIGSGSALLIMLINEIEARTLMAELKKKKKINSPDEVVAFAQKKLGPKSNEAFMAIYVNSRNGIEGYEVINEGTVNMAVVYPRNIIKNALQHNAVAIIVVHNHPTGECDPSSNDLHLTEQIEKAASFMDIKLLDHIIVGRDTYFSMKDEGLL